MESEEFEEFVEMIMGESYSRLIPKSKIPQAYEDSKWMIEKAVEAGIDRAVAEKIYSIKIIEH